jgi:hypothetical protein
MECLICTEEFENKTKRVLILCKDCRSQKHKLVCTECGASCSVSAYYYKTVLTDKYLCKSCNGKGERNSNFGKRWAQEQRDAQSELVKSKVDDEYRARCGKSMRGKTVSQETIDKQLNTKMERYGTLTTFNGHTPETLILIGEKSAAKFTPEYKEKRRQMMEQSGHWIPLSEKDHYLLYRELADWKGSMLSEEIVGKELLKTYSLKSKENNGANSLVRDHMYGRKAGFKNEVFPELLRHPANCQITTHSSNVKKSKSNNDCVITLEELFDKIFNWKYKYNEQSECLILIEGYRKGLRYKKEDYIQKYYKHEN